MARTFLCGGLLLDAVTTLVSLPAALELGGVAATAVAIVGSLWCCGSDLHSLANLVGETTLPAKLDLQQFVAPRF